MLLWKLLLKIMEKTTQPTPNLYDNFSGNIKQALTLNIFYERHIRGTLRLGFPQPHMKTPIQFVH